MEDEEEGVGKNPGQGWMMEAHAREEGGNVNKCSTYLGNDKGIKRVP